MAELFAATLKDDVTAASRRMATSIDLLDKHASQLFKASNGNFKDFNKSLKQAGVDAIDATIVTEKYRSELVKTRRELLGLGSDAKRTSSMLREITTGALRGIGERALDIPKSLASGAVTAVGWIGDKVYDVGKDLVGAVIEAAEFKQNSITGLQYMLGTKKEAIDIFTQAQALAQDTPLDTEKVISGIKSLVTQGFTGEESMLLFKVVADQASKRLDETDMADKVITAVSRVKGRGVASGEDFDSFRIAGFNPADISKALLAKPNLAPLFKDIKKDATELEKLSAVKKVLGQGKIDPTTFLNAAIDSLEKNKPDIGEFAKQMGKVSLTGTISNFKSAFKDLLKSVDIDQWTGVKSFQSFLTRVTEALQGDSGKRLLNTIERIINTLLGGLDAIKASDIDGFVDRIAAIGNEAVGVIKSAWKWLDELLHAEPGTLIDSIGDVLLDVGKQIGAGIWDGVKNAGSVTAERDAKFLGKYGISSEFASSKASELGLTTKEFLANYSKAKTQFYASGGKVEYGQEKSVNARTGIATLMTAEESNYNAVAPFIKQLMANVGKDGAQGLEQGARKELDSHSPSRTMARVGEDAARGLVLGTEKGIDEGKSPRGGVGDINISVNVGSVNGGDVDAVGQAIADVTVERILTALLERKAAEG